LARVVNTLEPSSVQALVAQATVERFDVRVVDGLAGSDEAHLDSVGIGPGIEVVRRELRAVVQYRTLSPACRPFLGREARAGGAEEAWKQIHEAFEGVPEAKRHQLLAGTAIERYGLQSGRLPQRRPTKGNPPCGPMHDRS
jgi:hypothetical protein